MKRIGFGSWLPDLPSLGNPGVLTAQGCVPVGMGYGPQETLTSLGETALDARARGALAVIDPAGNAFNFGGSATKLYRYGPAGREDVTRASGDYGCSRTGRWEMLQVKDIIFAMHDKDEMQYFDLASSENFADVGGGAPKARHAGVIGTHLIVAHTLDPVDGHVPERVWWPAISNPLSWPEPGSDLALSNQAGRQDLHAGAGWIQAVVSGAEVGAIFQERSIWRMDYRGGDIMYEFSRVEPERGLLVPHLAVPFGREVFYLAEDGFYRFDYTGSKPVGEEKVNRTFLADLDISYFDRVSAIAHPDRPLIYVLYPGSGNSGGTPNKLLVYNWKLDKFSDIALELELLTLASALGEDLDSMAQSSIDGLTTSFDDRQAIMGPKTLGAYDTSHDLGVFAGAAMAATIETGDVELAPGFMSMVTSVRPLVAGANATLRVATTKKTSETPTFGHVSKQGSSGFCPFRSKANGRYHRFRCNIPSGGFDSAIGMDVDSARTGTR